MRHSQNSGLHPRALGLGHQALTSGLPLAVDLTYQIKQPLFYVKVGYYQLHGAMNKERKRERDDNSMVYFQFFLHQQQIVGKNKKDIGIARFVCWVFL